MLKPVITRLSALPGELVLAGAVMVTLVIFCWQMVGLIALQRGDFIDENTLKLKSAGDSTPAKAVAGYEKPLARRDALVATTVRPSSPAVGKNIPLRERLQHLPGAGQRPSNDQ